MYIFNSTELKSIEIATIQVSVI